MEWEDVYISDLAKVRTKEPDRDGLFRMLHELIALAPKTIWLTVEQIMAKQTAYDANLRHFADTVQVVFEELKFRVVPALDAAMTYNELKYGASWYDCEFEVDSLVIAKIFWGAGS